MGIDVFVVVDTGDAEAEEFQEFGAVTGDVGEGGEVFRGDLRPEGGDVGLDVGLHLPVVDADAAGFVEGEATATIHLRAEEAVDLLDAAFVVTLGFHDLVEDRDVEGDDGDRGARLGDEGFVDGDEGASVAVDAEGGVDGFGGAFEVVFGEADGAVFVDGPGDGRSDVAVGDGGGAGSEELGLVEGVDPHLPVFAAHDGAGVIDLGLVGGLDGDLGDEAFVGVDGLVGVGLADGFEGGFVDDAGLGVGAAGGGEGIDDEVNLAEVLLDGGEDIGLELVGEGVAVEVFDVEAGFLGGGGEGGGVIPAGGGGLVWLGGALKEDADGGGAGAEGGGDARGEAVAGGGTDHEDLLGSVGDGAFGFHEIDLLLDVCGAAGGVSGNTDEATDFGFDDHRFI